MARIQELTMARGNRLLLLLALIAGMVAAVLVFVALQQDNSETPISAGGASASVVVAAQDISAGTEITDSMVETVELPESQLISNAIVDSELVVGETARVKISEREQFSAAKVGAENETEGISGVIPIGMRAYSISVHELTAVGGLLLPGNRVDVHMSVYWDVETESTLDDIVAHTMLLQDIEVLAVGQTAQEPGPVQSQADAAGAAATSGQLPTNLDEQPEAQTVTLALTPEQVSILVCALDNDQAQLSLALRAFGEPAPETRTLFDPCGGIVR
jgi:pilus assembly protein CpaB